MDLQENKQLLKSLPKINQKIQMMRKHFTLVNLREELENTKGNYPYSILIVEGLDILPLNAPTLNKMKMKKRKLRSSKCVNHDTRKNTMEKKIAYTMEDSEDSNGSENEELEVLFMGLDTQASNSDSDAEGELDLRA